MAEFGDGSTVEIYDKEAWSGLNPPKGGIVEVDLAGTNLPVFEETWAAFFTHEAEYNVDGSIYLNVRFMGAENAEVSAGIEAHFGSRLGYLHLCSSQPCVEMPGESRGPGVIHATILRTWTADNFKADYVTAKIYKELKKWIAGVKKSATAKRAPRKGALREPKSPRAGATPGTKETKDRKKTAAGEVRDGRKKDTKKKEDDAELDAEKREKLRERLKEVRKRHHEVGEDEPLPDVVGSGSEESGGDGAEDDSSGYAPSDLLTTGSNMKGNPKESHGRRSKGPIEKTGAVVPYKGTNGGSMRTWSGQLAQQALALNRARHSDKKRKKKKEGALQTLQDALRGVLGQDKGDKKKKKKKDKKKRKKRRIEGGVIRSSSNSSGSTSEDQEAEEESTSSDLEAPMKKKSREKPGSILALLIEHIKAQMEQDAALEIPDEQKKITSGVKVVSYFHQHIKSAYASHQKELREMYTLAAAVDLLRRGDVARVGDALSARFIAIHQSLLDQNCGAARHMELFPLEDAAAASSSMVLATRKHSKLVDRVQGKGTTTWTPWGGKGRGRGKGDWSYGGESTGKGKKGKADSKGRGKGKGWQNHERAASDWTKSQEKPDPPK